MLSKSELQQQLWPDTFVAEANLSNLIGEVRDALGDRARSPLFVRTVHGFGYAFCGNVDDDAATAGPNVPAHPCWLEWGRRRFPLAPGEHVIGRDPDAEIRLDASSVSRRHARLVVTADGVVLEDFGSKNGTFHHGARVTAPIRLADGDDIRIGSLLVSFHVRGPESTETIARYAP